MDNPNPTATGIYQIRNLLDGKVYIGSSSRMRHRWVMHRSLLRRGLHHSARLQRAWIKHGEENFVFEVLETISEPALLVSAENRHITLARSDVPKFGYNICPAAGTTLGVKLGPHSDEHRRKIGEAQKGKVISAAQRSKLSEARKGLVLHDEWRESIRKGMTGKKLKPLSPEHKAQISAVHKGKKLTAEQKAKLLAANKGRSHSVEDRQKKSAAGAAYWATQTPEQRLARMQKALQGRRRAVAPSQQLTLFPTSQE